MFKSKMLIGPLAAVLSAAGCYEESMVYGPAQVQGPPATAPAAPERPPVSTYPIPPNDPKGTVYVMSLGPERLEAGPGRPNMYLHVRIAAENSGDNVPWVVDPNDEVVGYGNGQGVPASFAQASTGGPVLMVPRGGRGETDLYYALPPTGQPAQVALSWRVHRGADTVAQTTSFERIVPNGAAQGYAYYQPNGADVRLSVGLDYWWWPWSWWGWGWGWGAWGHPYFGYRGWGGYYRGYGGGHPTGGGWRGGGGAVHGGGGHGGGHR